MNSFEEEFYCDKCKENHRFEIDEKNTYEKYRPGNFPILFTRCPICFNEIPLEIKTYFVKFDFSDDSIKIEAHSKHEAGVEYAEQCNQIFDSVKHLIIFKEEEENSN